MFNLNTAIKRVQKHYKIESNKDFVKLLDMPMSTLRDNLLKAKNEESNKKRIHTNSFYGKLLELCEKDNLNPNWVFFGKYPIYNDNLKEDIKIVYQDDLKEYTDDTTVALKYYKNMSDIVAPKNDFKFIVLPKIIIENSNIKAINFTLDSMMPNIKKDSVVFIDQNKKTIKDNCVYLVEYQNNISINRIEIIDNLALLKNDNKKYKTISAKNDEIKIIGKVVNSIQTIF
jgi:hypothetical protein